MSDGSLTPEDLVRRAQKQQVELFSVTDHDTLAAYRHLPDVSGVKIIPGIELSCVWLGATIHVLGLNVDTGNSALTEAVTAQETAREQRAVIIGERLARKGVAGVYEKARARADEKGLQGRALGRPDFARVLVDSGAVTTMQQAFDRYLGAGKIGDVKTHWPELAEVVEWIVTSGGTAVLAHPLHYKMTRTRLRRLFVDFMEAGGRALEVANGRQWTPNDLNFLRSSCKDFGLMASVGSDFHAETPWSEVGCDATLVGDCVPVWQTWL